LSRAKNKSGNIIQGALRTISVFSLKGGVGVSSLSVNLAIAISKTLKIETCLMDAAFSNGQLALMLNLKPQMTISTFANFPDEVVEKRDIANLIIKHKTGVNLLPAPVSALDAELITPRVINLLWPHLQTLAAYLVVDAGNHFSDANLTLMDRSDIILVVFAPEVASLRAASDALRIISKMNGYENKKIILVQNDIFPGKRVTTEIIDSILNDKKNKERVTKDKLIVEIPYDSDGFISGIQTGEPLLTASPNTNASNAIMNLASIIIKK
jgi:MinD-like ATPase involved in chromosome partitioning or flagellar assembly